MFGATQCTSMHACSMEWTQRSSKFDGFKRAQECRPECSGLSLLSLLIMPVQRVPRYKLLLEELLKYTPHDDLDWIKLDAACKKIGEVAIHINEHIRQHENFQEMLRIQRSLSGVPDILVPGRRFIKEGCLKKVCGRKLKERMCYLFSDLFVYARPNILETVDSASRYHCRGVLELAFCSVAVQTFDDVLHLPNTELLLKIQCKNHSLLLCAGSDGETQSWYNSMSAAIRGLLDQHRCLLEEVQKRITTDSTHALRNRISAHIDQSLDKTCNASDCYPNVSHNGFPHLSDMTMTSVKTLENSINSGHHSVDHKAKDMATRRVTVESRNEDIEAEDIITSGSSNLQAVEMTGKTHGLCVPMQRAARGTVNKLQTTTYDVERQRVHSTICTIL
ncbi:FYVE, RhoGEF and PH domain-containing protein 6-like [Corticium candelabrum]|uniref:FYVE, RhoGEF and PH domain-containing protein 6-like n=1 Tax=Corticium candelabrum TaxID=121492 RepID=UPI002E262AB9|nr:FYVE, RhoGEF and PH domain-containing protein 6-like [Corticium candelabrum]